NHFYIQLSGCSASDKEFVVEHDGDEILHSDFNKHGLVMKIPDFADPIEWHGGYEYSVAEQDACKHNLDFAINAFKNPPEALDAPQSSIYPRDDVHLGSNSTLICFSTRFFPPPVRIRWTRNGLNVTDESTLSQYYPNKDNTYNQFSHLPFTPQEGDVYTCTVEHKALQIPKTITWGE
ncbi:major histocompatibility complex class II integral membrane alpha chain precursor, partial [Silurus asotus]